jgi:VCBS repeat-containing protein
MIEKLPYNTKTDLATVTMIGTAPMVLTASKASGITSFKQLLADAKAKKANNYGSIGTGSLGHLALAALAKDAKFDWTHVPYRGGGPLMQDALAGHVPLAIGSLFLVKPHVDAGGVIPLAVTTSKRSPEMPNIPTIAESGYPNFEAPADAGANNVYNVTVTVRDNDYNAVTQTWNSTSQNLTITVTNVNEAPVVSSAATATVAENAAISTVVYTATATDVDAGDTRTFSLTGTDAALFAINAATGVVTLNASANFEGKPSYAINVVATDAGGLTSTQAVAVTVTNVNEAPVVTSAATATVAENAAISTVVYTATSTDVDAGDSATYSLGGADAAAFNINATTGAVTLKASADLETKAAYAIDVTATDKGGLTNTKAVAVSVTNVNEAPVVTSGATATVVENAAISTVIYTATATDVDAGDTRSFSLSGTDASAFDINATSGVVTLKASADFEA